MEPVSSSKIDQPRGFCDQRRRRFLNRSLSAAAAVVMHAAASARPRQGAAARSVFDGVIMGDTGHGDYGHELDRALNGIEGVRVVAVADPDPAGRAAAAMRTGAPRQYADYREMLDRERPQLAVVAPRWSERHCDMALAAIAAGAHVLLEKPITITPAQADAVLAAARKAAKKVSVMHQMRLSPSVVHLKRRVDDGLIGDLQQIRAFGKQDARAGGEDLLVLGVHLFDLMRLFAGEAKWCTARIRQGDHDITRADARHVKEAIGPVAGDHVFAQFAFDHGVDATFTSRAGIRDYSGHWGMELIGSRGAAYIAADIWPTVYALTPRPWQESGREQKWRRLPDDPTLNASPEDRSTEVANRRVVDDWLNGIRADRQPACSCENAAKALEMVMAPYHAALGGGRIALPLVDRRHPLNAP